MRVVIFFILFYNLTVQVSAKSWSEVRNGHMESASHGLHKSEGEKGEEERDRPMSYSSGKTWSMIQAGNMNDNEFHKRSKSALIDKSIPYKDGNDTSGINQSKISEKQEPPQIDHTEQSQKPPDGLKIEMGNNKHTSGNDKNILSPIRTVEEGKSFRRNSENDEESVMIALRSSDFEHEESPFRGSATGKEDMKELTPLSVKTTFSKNTAKDNLNPPDGNKESEELKPLRTTQEKTVSVDEDSMMLQAFRTVEKQQNETARKEIHDKEKLVTSVLGNTIQDMSQKGINVNLLNSNNDENKVPGCKENEIFFMNKEKMFLVSSEKLVHDISGIASLLFFSCCKYMI